MRNSALYLLSVCRSYTTNGPDWRNLLTLSWWEETDRETTTRFCRQSHHLAFRPVLRGVTKSQTHGKKWGVGLGWLGLLGIKNRFFLPSNHEKVLTCYDREVILNLSSIKSDSKMFGDRPSASWEGGGRVGWDLCIKLRGLSIWGVVYGDYGLIRVSYLGVLHWSL